MHVCVYIEGVSNLDLMVFIETLTISTLTHIITGVTERPTSLDVCSFCIKFIKIMFEMFGE